jgi:serine protease
MINKNKLFKVAILPTLILGVCSASAVNAADRYIIKYKQGWDGNSTPTSSMSMMAKTNRNYNNQKHIEKFGGKVKRSLAHRNAISAEMTEKQVQKLMASGQIDFVELDPKRSIFEPMTTSDSTSTSAITPMAESTPYGISMVQADLLSDGSTGSVTVCITDTGYDGDHEDLRSYLGSNIDGDDNAGSGNDTGNWYEDGYGHGTHVAGTISAIGGNGTGVVGVNPSDQIGLHIVKVFNDSGSWAYGSDMVTAIDQCVAGGAKVISMSLGGSGSSTTEQNAFDDAYDAGVLLIAASGNDGTSSGNDSYSYPASYDSVMSVAAIDSSSSVASWSQKNDQVEIAAPGVDVMSTLPDDSYEAWSGTSMATPHVSAVAALVWSHFPSCSNVQIRAALNATAEDLGTNGLDESYGNGLVLAKDAYDYLETNGCEGGDPDPDPDPEPVEDVLENGVAQTGLAASTGADLMFTMEVPAGATNISFVMSGGSGDADMYVSFGSEPTDSSYDCRPYVSGNSESCTGTSSGGTYYVRVKAYSTFANVTLTGSYDEDSGGGGATGDTFEETNLSASRRSWVYYTVEIPSGMSSFDVAISGGTGDADLYVNEGSAVGTSNYDCRPYKSGNEESWSFTTPNAGTWTIGIRAYSAFTGVTLSGSYE